jgi:hypothetical protein
MFKKIIGCYVIITSLTPYQEIPSDLLLSQLNTCTEVLKEVEKQQYEGLKFLMLAVTWQESRFTMDAKGRWICSNKGKLLKDKKNKPYCSKGRMTRGRGPMQVLPLYHCPKKGPCDYLKESVSLLGYLVDLHGEKKGVALYAGGYVNPASLRYYWQTISTKKKIKILWGRIKTKWQQFALLKPQTN